MVGKMLAPLGFLTLLAVAGPRTEVTAGAGGGTYIYHPACSPAVRVPYREVGAEIRHTGQSGVTGGAQASVREDGRAEVAHPTSDTTAEDAALVQPATRFRLAPFLGYEHRWFRVRTGAVVTNYYNPDEEHRAYILPLVGLGVGTDVLRVEAGLLDAPALASSAEGGLGILSVRASMGLGRGRLTVGGGLGQDEPYLGGGFATDLGAGLTLGAGGYATEGSSGGFVTLATTM